MSSLAVIDKGSITVAEARPIEDEELCCATAVELQNIKVSEAKVAKARGQ